MPLFVEEFTKMVQESGMLERVGDDSPHTPALSVREIPASLQDLLMARLDRMDGDHEVIQLAATLGREFSHELLAVASDMDESTLLGEIDEAGSGGDSLSERPAARLPVRLQARASRGCRV